MITDSYPADSSAIPEHPDQPARQGTKRTSLTRAVAIAALGLLGTTCGKFIDDPTDPIVVGSAPTGAAVGYDLPSSAVYDCFREMNGRYGLPASALEVGTGVVNPVPGIQNDPSEHGFDTGATQPPLDAEWPNLTNALPLNFPLIRGGPHAAGPLGDLRRCDEYVEGDFERHRPEAR